MICSFASYEELYVFLLELGGYGQKTGGLLLRTFYDYHILPSKSALPIIPLDRHDIEISYLCGIIEKKNLRPKELLHLSSQWINAGLKYKVDASAIDQYLWYIGAHFCSHKQCTACPLNGICKTKNYEEEMR